MSEFISSEEFLAQVGERQRKPPKPMKQQIAEIVAVLLLIAMCLLGAYAVASRVGILHNDPTTASDTSVSSSEGIPVGH